MTIDTEVTAPEKGAEGEVVADAPKDDLESVAREMGWKPESEWKGEPPEGGFATAADFVRSQRQHAKNVEKELRKLRSDTDRRIERIEKKAAKDREAAVEKAVSEIHGEYDWWIRKAIKEGDEEREGKLIKERDEKVKEAKAAGEKDEDEDTGDEFDEEEFIEKFKPSFPEAQKRFYSEGHAWILDDDADPDAMRIVLDYVDSGIPFADALEKADKALRKAYPENYEDEEDEEDDDPQPKGRNGKRIPILSPGGRGNGGRVSAASRLSAAQRQIGEKFVREGLFANLEEYAEERLKMEA